MRVLVCCVVIFAEVCNFKSPYPHPSHGSKLMDVHQASWVCLENRGNPWGRLQFTLRKIPPHPHLHFRMRIFISKGLPTGPHPAFEVGLLFDTRPTAC